MSDNTDNSNNKKDVLIENNQVTPDSDHQENTESIEPVKWYHQISVEPVIFLNMFAYMLTSVVDQTFYLYKACSVNHNQSDEICNNLEQNEYQEINEAVHITVSNFHQWNNIARFVIPMFLALFLGAWSDRRGRKLPLLMGIFGKFLAAGMTLVNATQKTWPIEYLIFTVALPSAFTGGDVALYSSCFSYVSDITKPSERTLRLTIVDICNYIAMPTGVALGSYLFTYVVFKSFTVMYIIKSSLLAIAIIYVILNLKWQSTSKQRPLSELNCLGLLPDFFDKQHLIDSIRVAFKKRRMHRRTYLWICFFVIGLFSFARDERNMLFLHAQYTFQWDTEAFSYFKTFETAAFAVMMLGAIPLMSKFIGLKDIPMAIIGASCVVVSRLFYGFAEVAWVFYVGAAICGIGPIVATVIRSIMSKLVPLYERGKVFAILAVFDNAIPFVTAVLYTQVYNASFGKTAGVFWLTASTQIAVIVLILIMHISLRGRPFDCDEDERDKEDKLTPKD